nr:hypothetical protein [uncultured Cupriavidus sp.]
MPATNPSTKPRKAATRPARAELVMTNSRATNSVRVKFGDVTVIAPKPTEEQVEQGVRDSMRAMRGLVRCFRMQPSTPLHGPEIPVFTADRENPERVIRTLNGKSESGRFRRGKFKAD